ncbi:Variant-specific surface protein [Giardia duodenalis assemblage B]|uniref:Variant-specific surface protein n=1 Tax=Giardia duodenalis assemblage B TaxID=1394984 RepID=A0A132NN84_GIAIN|nr:Variant-specific surface protein [Giardia intestinalis assemblage B]
MLAICFAVGALAAACNASGTTKDNCATDMCDTIGETEICTRCEATYVPINGKCVLASGAANCKDAAGSAAGEQTCGKCLSTTFMYKGGCYDSTVPPGNVICSEAGSTAGQCETCADGYFKNSGASPTSDSCSECDPTCLTYSAAGENGCTACAEGTHFLGAASGKGKCVSCGDASGSTWKGVANCAKCDKPINENTPAVCTKCAENYYLKTDGATSCVTDCGEGFFTTRVDNVKKCVSCSAVGNGGIANCKTCSLLAQGSRAAPLVSCLTCEQDKHLTPTKEACLDACPAGSYSSGGACVPCDPSCAECSAAGPFRHNTTSLDAKRHVTSFQEPNVPYRRGDTKQIFLFTTPSSVVPINPCLFPNRRTSCQRVSLRAPLPGCSECVPPDGLLTRECCTTVCRSLVNNGESEYSNVQDSREGHSSRSDPTSHAIQETEGQSRRAQQDTYPQHPPLRETDSA